MNSWPALTPTLSPRRGSATSAVLITKVFRRVRSATLPLRSTETLTRQALPSLLPAPFAHPLPGGEGRGEGEPSFVQTFFPHFSRLVIP